MLLPPVSVILVPANGHRSPEKFIGSLLCQFVYTYQSNFYRFFKGLKILLRRNMQRFRLRGRLLLLLPLRPLLRPVLPQRLPPESVESVAQVIGQFVVVGRDEAGERVAGYHEAVVHRGGEVVGGAKEDIFMSCFRS